ncbi:thiosulfate sulfurtransferase [Burkholderiales bacterium]|nr:thiosulfate sulfurtransferase [Burkholderiales bacterium]
MIRDLAPADLLRWRSDASRVPPVVVDVREPWELERCALSDVIHVPMNELPGRLDELPRGRDLVVVCHHGVRSRYAARYLATAGFAPVWNLAGGVEAWAADVDPAMPRY